MPFDPPKPKQTSGGRSFGWWWLFGVALLAAVGIGFVAARMDRGEYPQDTPDAVIESAKLMVRNGKAAHLTRLFAADDENMRRLLERLGRLLGNLQTLGNEIATKYPTEIAELKAEAEAAAKSGRATSILARMTNQRSALQRRPKMNEAERQKQQEAMSIAIKGMFVDPYSFLEEQSGRLTTTMINDEVAAVLWDNAPVLPPFGLTMKQEKRGDKLVWAIVLPTGFPGVAQYMPRNEQEYRVLGSVIRTLDNVIVDLTADVRAGKLSNLDEVSRAAGEKAFLPTAMTIYAYGRVVEARKKTGP